MSTIVSSISPQERFKQHFDRTIRWGSGKVIDNCSLPDEAFEKSNYLLFPKSRRNYLCLDLDWEGGISVWMDEGLPQPTISFVNNENSHGTLAYELKKPIYWPCNENFKKIRISCVNYFKAVLHGYEKKTSADPGYTNASIKNPFSSKWKVTWHDEAYDLNYLAEFVDVSSDNRFRKHDKDKIYAGRNEELFHIARKWSVSIVKQFNDYDVFYEGLYNYLLEQNYSVISVNWSSKGPLSESEVLTISRNVSRYIWNRKDDAQYKYIFKNYGVMNLKDIDSNVSDDDKEIIVKERQSLGAKYVHEIRKNNTLEVICNAILKLSLNNQDLSYNKISIESGISYKTILKYKSQIVMFKNRLLESKS